MSEEAKPEETTEETQEQPEAPVEEEKKEEGAPPIVQEIDLNDDDRTEVTDEYLEQELEKAMRGDTDEPELETTEELVPEETVTATELTEEVTEVADEPEAPKLPEFMDKYEGDVNLEDEDLVDSIEFWGGGTKADWTRQNVDQMPEDKQEKFKAVQRAYNKHKDKPREEPQPYQFTEAEKDKALDDLGRMLQGDQEVIQKYRGMAVPEDTKAEPTPEAKEGLIDNELMTKLSSAVGEGDTELFSSVFKEVLSDVVAKTAKQVRAEASQDALTQFEQQRSEQMISDQRQKWETEAASLAQTEGSAFTQYVQNSAIQDLLGIGYDPITRTPVKTVQDAYNICRNIPGGKPVVSRPSPATRTLQPANEGSEPTLDDLKNEMDRPLDEYLEMAADLTFRKQ